MADSEFGTTDVTASADIDADIEDDVAENIDRQAGYDHDAASEIQTLLAELENSTVDIAEEATAQTDQIADVNRRMDDLVTDLQTDS